MVEDTNPSNEEKTEVTVTDTQSSSDAQAKAAASLRQQEIDSLDVSKVKVLDAPTFSKKLGFDSVSLKKIKKQETSDLKKIVDIPFFYFIKDSQRYMVIPNEVLDKRESCVYTICLLNLFDLFNIKMIECSESITTTTKPVDKEIINLVDSIPLTAYGMTQREDLNGTAKQIVRNALIFEHFLLRSNGNKYNRNYTKYKSVKGSFADNYLSEEFTPYQKQLLAAIRSIIIKELRSYDINKSDVIQFDNSAWKGSVPRSAAQVFTPKEKQLIAVASACKTNNELNIDRNLELKDQNDQVVEYIKNNTDSNNSYKNRVFDVSKNRYKAISNYFPLSAANKNKKIKFSVLLDDYKLDASNLESLNCLQLVPGDDYMPTPLSTEMQLNDDAYAKAHADISKQTRDDIATAFMAVFLEQKALLKTISSTSRR
jgi:hypothetical protein